MGGHGLDGRQPVAAVVPLLGRPHVLGHGRRPSVRLEPAYTTKRHPTAIGKFPFMGLIGLILAGLVDMIWRSGTVSFIVSAAGV